MKKAISNLHQTEKVFPKEFLKHQLRARALLNPRAA